MSQSTMQCCSHCGRPSPTVICASCFLNYDPHQYETSTLSEQEIIASSPVRKNLWNGFTYWETSEEDDLAAEERLDDAWEDDRYGVEPEDDHDDEGGSFFDWLSRMPRLR